METMGPRKKTNIAWYKEYINIRENHCIEDLHKCYLQFKELLAKFAKLSSNLIKDFMGEEAYQGKI